MLIENRFVKTDRDISYLIGRSRIFVVKVKAFNDMTPACLQIVSTVPALFGFNLAYQLKTAGFNKTHPGLVEEALQRVKDGHLTQAGVMTWLANKTSTPTSAPLKDATITINDKAVRITCYQDTIRVSSKGMDTLALESVLIEPLGKLL